MKALFIASLLLSNIAFAEPYAKADAIAGKILAEKNCISCHAASFGGDGSAIYTRESHKVKTSKGLVDQIRSCHTNLDLKWLEDDELNIAKYLNKTYYKFTE